MASLTRRIAGAVAPGIYRRISFYRNEGRLLRITKKLVARHGAQVLGGPFAGMRYLQDSVGSVLNPKLIGCYEAELHSTIEEIISRNYEAIIDIGCAEGYYAVGFLLRTKQARCVAFDIDAEARRLCREMADLNQVSERLVVRGCCDAASLSNVLLGRTFILSDCEGAELDILNPAAIPGLRHSDLLVELHDFLRPGLTASLTERFRTSHDLQIIEQQDRLAQNYPQIKFLSKDDRKRGVQEFRPARMRWGVFRSKAGLV